MVVNVMRGGYGELWVCDLVRGSTSRLMSERVDCPERRLDARRPRDLRHAAPEPKVEPLAGRGRRREPARAPDRDRRHPEPEGRFAGRPLRGLRARRGPKADLWLLPLDGSGPAAEWLEAGGNQGFGASFSPDGSLPGVRVGRDGPLRGLREALPGRRGAMAGVDGRRAAAGLVAAGGEIFYRSRDRMMSVEVSARGGGTRGRRAQPALRGADRKRDCPPSSSCRPTVSAS